LSHHPASFLPPFISVILRFQKVLLNPFLSKEPASVLIRQTAQKQWRLISINLASGILEAFTAGATLGVVFLAVEVLSERQGVINWTTKPLLSWSPTLIFFLNNLTPSTLFICLLALAILLQAFQSLSRYFYQVSLGYFAARCRALVTARIHSQVLSFSFPCASAYKVGDLTDHSTEGVFAIRQQIELSSSLVLGLLLGTTYLAVLMSISPWLVLAAAGMGGAITLVQRRLLPRIRHGSKRVSQTQVKVVNRIIENFQGLRLLHSIGQLDAADQRLRATLGDLESELRSQARRLAVIGPFSSFLPVVSISVIAAMSLLLLGERSSGVMPSLITFVVALQRLNQRLSGIASTSNAMADNSGRLNRLNAILSPAGKDFRRQGGVPFDSLKQVIRFENVQLCYGISKHPALDEISFELPKGQTLALVGPSGAGKSSIADLLVGLYSSTNGVITIDGVSMADLDLKSWQQHLGIVSQDTFLLNASLAENISFGTFNCSDDQIREAAEAAQAHGFIQKLPEGYDTIVGERGYRLSGGQRQRISLARAILRKPELLILDEATSALDTESERLVQESIHRFERKHTVLIIAHRLSTIMSANKIIVLDRGRIAESGSHSELMANDGLYSYLWKQQSLLQHSIPC
jgi:subfamily B ATP-binding cassette protein MsbA